jgi:hypothetical protein
MPVAFYGATGTLFEIDRAGRRKPVDEMIHPQ